MKTPQGLVVDDLAAFTEAGRRLRELDPGKFRRLLALARAFVALHDPELESHEEFLSRCAEIAPRSPKHLA